MHPSWFVWGGGLVATFVFLFFVLVSLGSFGWWISVCDVGFVSVCVWGWIGLCTNMNIRLRMRSFIISTHAPLRRYIARCRIAAQTTTLCGRGSVYWVDADVRLILDWLVALLLLIELLVAFSAAGSKVLCGGIRLRCCWLWLVFSSFSFGSLRAGRHTSLLRRLVRMRSG